MRSIYQTFLIDAKQYRRWIPQHTADSPYWEVREIKQLNLLERLKFLFMPTEIYNWSHVGKERSRELEKEYQKL